MSDIVTFWFSTLTVCLVCVFIWALSLRQKIKDNAVALDESASALSDALAKQSDDALTISDQRAEASRLAAIARTIAAPHVGKKKKKG